MFDLLARAPTLRRCAPARCPRPASPPRAPRAARCRTKPSPIMRLIGAKPPAPVEVRPRRPRRHGADRAPNPQYNSALVRQKRHPMLSAESFQGLGRAQRGGGVAAQDFEIGFPEERMWPSTGRGRVRSRARFAWSISSRARSTSPNCHMRHREDRTIATVPVSSPKRSRVSSSRSGSQASSARSQWVRASSEIAGKVADQGEAAAGDAGFRRAAPRPPLPAGTLEASSRADRNSPRTKLPRSIDRGPPRSAPAKSSVVGRELRGAREGGLGFLGGEALGPHHRLAVGRLQMQPALALRVCGLDLVRLRQRREQRLRLGDLRHFRRRRKAFERGREDGVGVGGAAGRLVELGERQRRAQFEAARALLLRDGDGGQEGFFRGRGVGGVALEQDFAARPMQFRFERAIAGAVGTSPALRRGSQWRGRDRPPGLRPRPAQSSIARRTTERSVRAAARRRGACPRARRRARRSQRSPNPRETRRTRATGSARARARGGRVRRRSARRARGRRASIRTGPRAFFQTRACRHG